MRIPEWVKPGIWGAVVGAVLFAAVGFSQGLIVTSGNAQEMAKDQSNQALLAALTPICIAQFRSASKDKQATSIAALEAESYWSRGDYVEEQGWATMPGSEQPNDAVAEACASQLLDLAKKG